MQYMQAYIYLSHNANCALFSTFENNSNVWDASNTSCWCYGAILSATWSSYALELWYVKRRDSLHLRRRIICLGLEIIFTTVKFLKTLLTRGLRTSVLFEVIERSRCFWWRRELSLPSFRMSELSTLIRSFFFFTMMMTLI